MVLEGEFTAQIHRDNIEVGCPGMERTYGWRESGMKLNL